MASGMVVSEKILITEPAFGGGFRVMSYQCKLSAAIQLVREYVRDKGACDEAEELLADLIRDERKELCL